MSGARPIRLFTDSPMQKDRELGLKMRYTVHDTQYAARFTFRVLALALICVLFALAGGARAVRAAGPLPLSAYPRPLDDNGIGIHWSTNLYGESRETTDYFVRELVAMDIKWVKFLNDGTEGRHHDYLVEQLVAHDIMPIMRIYTRHNDPLDVQSLRRLVRHYLPMGVYYYELYNEPNFPGTDAGWRDDQDRDVDYLLRSWVSAARVIEEEGGYPSVPSMFPPSTKDPKFEQTFFQQFFRRLKANGDTDVLYRAWIALHNYTINHPIRYPYDAVNLHGTPLSPTEIARYHIASAEVAQINHFRAISHKPRTEGGYYVGSTIDQDSYGFLQFLAYHKQFTDIFGFEIPIIGTEGGTTVGNGDDPRYPRITPDMQRDMTLEAVQYMLDEAPAYYFAYTSWLIAQRGLDYHNTAWETDAWYHDRKGNHLPVVEALKSFPRRGEMRRNAPGGNQGRVSRRRAAPGATAKGATAIDAAAYANLARFPRPRQDNGWGVHWSTGLFGQPPAVVDRYIAELRALQIKWVKITQGDVPKIAHPYLIRQLVAGGIMPVVRIYQEYNDPPAHLAEIVREGRPMGVYYYELFNEPNIAGQPGGWRDGESISVSRIANLWIPAAETVVRGGGFPSLPALTPGGDYDDVTFLDAFLAEVERQGRGDLLRQSWLPLHNYFLNHPLDYPEDSVNLQGTLLSEREAARRGLSPEQVRAINHARQIARLPRAQGGFYRGSTIYEDSNAFRKFEAYHKVVMKRVGFAMPIISTEGGAIAGSQEDPRYPPVSDGDVARWTVAAYNYVLDQAPPYYFAFMPWLLVNQAAGGGSGQWEAAAWYKMDGTTLPVVPALKTNVAGKGSRTRRYSPAQIAAWIATGAPGSGPVAGQAAPATTFSSPAVAGEPTVVPGAEPYLIHAARAATLRWRREDTGAVQVSLYAHTRLRGQLQLWNGGQIAKSWALELSPGDRLTDLWKPANGAPGMLGLRLLDSVGNLLDSYGTTDTPPAMPSWSRTTSPVARASSSPRPLQWDPRLDEWGVRLKTARARRGQTVWRLVQAVYQDPTESSGNHNIYVELIDEQGRRIVGERAWVIWDGGQVPIYTKDKPAPEYAADFPMYAKMGSYRVEVDGISDAVLGMGLPVRHHVNFLLTFQRTRAAAGKSR